MGWRYVCRWKGIDVFCDLNLYGEVHENPNEYFTIIKRGHRAVLFDILKLVALLSIIMLVLIKIICRNNTPWLNLLDKDAILLLAFTCLL